MTTEIDPTFPAPVGRREIVLAIAASFGDNSAVRAAVRFVSRRERWEHPAGKLDSGGRWYPASSERFEAAGYRPPSRAWPFSYMFACRTAVHCAALESADDVTLVRRVARIVDRAPNIEAAVGAVREALAAAQPAGQKNVSASGASDPGLAA